MAYREQGSHAQGVYPKQSTRVEQEEETDESSKKFVRNKRGHEWEKSQTRPN